MQTITINGNSYNLVTLPSTPGPSAIEIAMNDAVAVTISPFTGQQQTQQWSGGDWWDATVTLPPMTLATAAAWRAFLAELRGRANVFQLADPSAPAPGSVAVGTPVVDSSNPANNQPMTTALVTRGWTVSTNNLMFRGQQLQIGYRLHLVCEAVNSDANGDATLAVWPSIRETPADGTTIVLTRPMGLFRLAVNRRAAQWSPSRLAAVSFQCTEAR